LDSPAFLQYTSGSTNTPTGVVITHRNLICNQEQIRRAFEHDDSTRFAGWLPMFHDMGLVGNVLHPAYLGIECTLMPPAAFIQRPSRWLRAISSYRATTSGGPNFAFDHCVNRIAEIDIDTLDLSCWRVAFNGAEPVRARTIRAFAQKFARCGFSATSFLPCYGLAEATLFVSGRSRYRQSSPTTLRVIRSRLEQGVLELAGEAAAPDCVDLVSSGPPSDGQRVIIIDPQNGLQCDDGKIGEIWLAGPNIAANCLDSCAEDGLGPAAKAAHDVAQAGFLATGDLGALWDGELFVIGRIKNLIIVRGRNIHAEDIEQVVSHSHDLLQPNRCAAFAVEPPGDAAAGDERIVIIQEATRRPRHAGEVRDALARAREVTVNYTDVSPHEILLVRAGTIPTTSSGKIQHTDIRAAYLQGRIVAIEEERQPAPA
jgi:acyl-CoA synthetase (AMP-forming)/AMP-acid ligase II